MARYIIITTIMLIGIGLPFLIFGLVSMEGTGVEGFFVFFMIIHATYLYFLVNLYQHINNLSDRAWRRKIQLMRIGMIVPIILPFGLGPIGIIALAPTILGFFISLIALLFI